MAKEVNEISDELQFLWKKRDEALEFERKNGINLRTSNMYKEAQSRVDDYFFPKEEKAKRKKPKKKVYSIEDEWMY